MCHHVNRPAAQHHDELPGKSIALRNSKGVSRERAGERSWGAARPRGLAKAAATPQQRSSYYSQRAIPPSTGGCASRLRPADKAHALSQQIGRTTRPAGATGVPGEGTARHADLDLGGLAPANHNTSQRSRLFERVHDRNDGRRGNHFNRRSTSGIQEIVQDTPRRPQRRQPRHGGAAYEVRSGSQATTRCMHRREKTAASRMDVRSAAGLGRGSHRSSHTPAPPHREAQARREIPPSPPQVGLSRTASAGGSTVGEEVQGFPAPVWILLKNEVLRRHGVRVPGLQHPR